ncbi:hypothetical protein AVEN_17501-1 [Araneus ventricosus]|uniref:Uncharacterized protein n=1 Tax=Araneus ventricosus TaxID=182803 RepID=A0A4Y2JG83_ARAVE|nr:hypothetical protein AVEN_17501-1 [Araneus ventricosus]
MNRSEVFGAFALHLSYGLKRTDIMGVVAVISSVTASGHAIANFLSKHHHVALVCSMCYFAEVYYFLSVEYVEFCTGKTQIAGSCCCLDLKKSAGIVVRILC